MQLKRIELAQLDPSITANDALNAALLAGDDHLGAIEAFSLLGHLMVHRREQAGGCLDEFNALTTLEVIQAATACNAAEHYFHDKQPVRSYEDKLAITARISEERLAQDAQAISEVLPDEATGEWKTAPVWNRWFTGVNREISCYLLAKQAHHRFFMFARADLHRPIALHIKEHGELPSIKQQVEVLGAAVPPYVQRLVLEGGKGDFCVYRLAGWQSRMSAGYKLATMIIAPDMRDEDLTKGLLIDAARNRTVPFEDGAPAAQGVDVFPFRFNMQQPQEPQGDADQRASTIQAIKEQLGAVELMREQYRQSLFLQADALLLAGSQMSGLPSLPNDIPEALALASLNEAQLHVAFGMWKAVMERFDYNPPEDRALQREAITKVQAESYAGWINSVEGFIKERTRVRLGAASTDFWREIHEGVEDEEPSNLYLLSKHICSHALARLTMFALPGLEFPAKMGIPLRSIEMPTFGMLISTLVRPWITRDLIDVEDDVYVSLLSGWIAPVENGHEAALVGSMDEVHRNHMMEVLMLYSNPKGKALPPFSADKPLVQHHIVMPSLF